MDFKVIWSPSARADLRDIVTFIAEDNSVAAERFGTTLIEASKALGRFERKGRKVPEFGIEDIRELIVPPYRMIYRLEESKSVLEIIRLWHGARGQPKI
ncbi:MAG: type II toxin-antitoxin system RelE/ParE family toxin [Oceanipulchritudo sp.]|jgi:addiction module RelE/StbE family toxin